MTDVLLHNYFVCEPQFYIDVNSLSLKLPLGMIPTLTQNKEKNLSTRVSIGLGLSLIMP